MIPRSEPSWQMPWQQELQQLITNPEALLQLVELDRGLLPQAQQAAALFPLRVTRAYASRIEKGNPQDPLLRQVLPLGAELQSPANYSLDPLAEQEFNPLPGVVHKYKSRVLLITATQCAINCRYCFRRNFPYAENHLNRNQWQAALNYIREHTELNEVIFSGGDPLAVSDAHLHWLVQSIAAIPHIKRVRIHTRLPIVLPSRITPELIQALTGTRLRTIVVVHCNHAQEIDLDVRQALQNLHDANIVLLNQTVLLRGVNDCSHTLTELSEMLFDAQVLPYYLHLLDAVQGASHFAVDEANAKNLYHQLLAELPGFLVPKLVKEIPKKASKTPIAPY